MDKGQLHVFVFDLHGSRFAIDATAVWEVVRLPEITRVEEAPTYIAGVINLRGRVIPVVDFSVRLGLPPAKYRLTDGLLVIEVDAQMTGIVVNDVHDVIALDPEDIDPVLFPGKEGDAPIFIRGEARVGDEIVMLLDHNRLLVSGDYAEILVAESASEEESPESDFLPLAELTPEERAVFHSRALGLIGKSQAEEARDACQLAVVSLGGEYFGIDLAAVREFTSIGNLTPLPNCPEHLVGIMNHRGSLLPIIDIRELLSMPTGAFTHEAKVIVPSDDHLTVGLAIDMIHDIVSLPPAEISPLPASVASEVETYALGSAVCDDRPVTILALPPILEKLSLMAGAKQ
ncbi:purine-binding chemotaxis protein CheW [Desulfuromusa kysingii]|uniref:Purine-binding chemotaxis protein CheW n=1 Tax=Desulfuromusa kysingii TaxID=37625 RepID=A0A1H3VZM5_9BACT|nr:chemotaxis protein CheW [Desulfuromusa kysingii]SDZ80190.1 purine-binding chemotaxis protein CheW [Desulfuromusa kysingii]